MEIRYFSWQSSSSLIKWEGTKKVVDKEIGSKISMFPLTFFDWELNSWMKRLISCHHYAAEGGYSGFFVTIKEFCEVPQLELEFWRNLPITSPKLITSLPSPSLIIVQYLFTKQHTLSAGLTGAQEMPKLFCLAYLTLIYQYFYWILLFCFLCVWKLLIAGYRT